MNERLRELISCIPLIKDMIGVDATICVWNKDGVVEGYFNASGNKDVGIKKGHKAQDSDAKIYEVLRTGIPLYNRVPKEVYGVAFEGTITPIFDGREVVGVVTYTFCSETKDGIVESANQLAESITKTDKAIEEITQGSNNLTENMNQVQEITEKVAHHVDEAIAVVTTIQDNAKFSNILALNASIESARAGEAGKGFAIVSGEMRKFSQINGDAAKKIQSRLEGIVNSLNEVKDSIDNSAIIAAEQAEAANELNEMFVNVTVTADKVVEICNKVKQI